MSALYLLLIFLILFMTLKGGTSGACASCKYQRRRCAADCPLAPYFPAENPKIFQDVHRLFGVKSLVKILKNLNETQKAEAMKSIIYQSYIRDRNPVHGCLGIIQQLRYMICLVEEELKTVKTQLQLCRSQQNNNNENNSQNHHNAHNQREGEKHEDVTSHQDLGMRNPVNNNQCNITPLFSPLLVSETHQQPQMSYTYGSGEDNNNGYSPHAYTDSCREILSNPYHHHNKGFSNQKEHCNEMKNNNDVMAIQSQLSNLQMVSNQQEEEDDVHEYNEIPEFLEMINNTRLYADFEELFASSSGESLKKKDR